MLKPITLSGQASPMTQGCYYCQGNNAIKVPCLKCEQFMRQGIICIGIDPERTTDPSNPYRDGNWCVITLHAMRKLLKPEMQALVARTRCAFIDTPTWLKLHLPSKQYRGAEPLKQGYK